ncbi:hypothetical protein B0T26DRAFT_752083 [Lasiosphaeria miniovina]|uniref:Uncharacterized protein n=1 Tax=Lasiosphaeria miniovina TaxID=1954250 RepID=A0AA40DWF3_9PEZI|nr:uncharacterized protein B0T26DRAFT_752083 [Lasiosphaeria miniovina]KAK0718115.1 hypothetical protein B0T26DRAFT_752083 [Lasiosphaeria miniovina]
MGMPALTLPSRAFRHELSASTASASAGGTASLPLGQKSQPSSTVTEKDLNADGQQRGSRGARRSSDGGGGDVGGLPPTLASAAGENRPFEAAGRRDTGENVNLLPGTVGHEPEGSGSGGGSSVGSARRRGQDVMVALAGSMLPRFGDSSRSSLAAPAAVATEREILAGRRRRWVTADTTAATGIGIGTAAAQSNASREAGGVSGFGSSSTGNMVPQSRSRNGFAHRVTDAGAADTRRAEKPPPLPFSSASEAARQSGVGKQRQQQQHQAFSFEFESPPNSPELVVLPNKGGLAILSSCSLDKTGDDALPPHGPCYPVRSTSSSYPSDAGGAASPPLSASPPPLPHHQKPWTLSRRILSGLEAYGFPTAHLDFAYGSGASSALALSAGDGRQKGLGHSVGDSGSGSHGQAAAAKDADAMPQAKSHTGSVRRASGNPAVNSPGAGPSHSELISTPAAVTAAGTALDVEEQKPSMRGGGPSEGGDSGKETNATRVPSPPSSFLEDIQDYLRNKHKANNNSSSSNCYYSAAAAVSDDDDDNLSTRCLPRASTNPDTRTWLEEDDDGSEYKEESDNGAAATTAAATTATAAAPKPKKKRPRALGNQRQRLLRRAATLRAWLSRQFKRTRNAAGTTTTQSNKTRSRPKSKPKNKSNSITKRLWWRDTTATTGKKKKATGSRTRCRPESEAENHGTHGDDGDGDGDCPGTSLPVVATAAAGRRGKKRGRGRGRGPTGTRRVTRSMRVLRGSFASWVLRRGLSPAPSSPLSSPRRGGDGNDEEEKIMRDMKKRQQQRQRQHTGPDMAYAWMAAAPGT